jgi:hypothetical protein
MEISNPKEVRRGFFKNKKELNHKLFILEGDR